MNEQDTLYPIGTEVQIKLESPYKHQGFKDDVKLKGVVTNCYDKRKFYVNNHTYFVEPSFRVEWSNGSSNIYRPNDIELWQEEKPIVQELASLPEKWCVKVTKDNRETLIKMYVKNLLLAKNKTTEAEENLRTHIEKIAFLEAKLKAINEEVEA